MNKYQVEIHWVIYLSIGTTTYTIEADTVEQAKEEALLQARRSMKHDPWVESVRQVWPIRK